ncbi:Adiponectin receptor protein 2 [Smittium culicis]|uniref:Adiponectin receptor protein 2 n=1 Tax=Smittium culicis TaxID=133412 RepID=A0A1R1YT54_9FUNG|nr:Adiponectin receptor protein 2 [Smittium culicis]
MNKFPLSRLNSNLTIFSDSVSETVTFTRPISASRASINSLPLDPPSRPWCDYPNRVFTLLKKKQLEIRNILPPLPPISFSLQNVSFSIPTPFSKNPTKLPEAPQIHTQNTNDPSNQVFHNIPSESILNSEIQIINSFENGSNIENTIDFPNSNIINHAGNNNNPPSLIKEHDTLSISSNTTNVSSEKLSEKNTLEPTSQKFSTVNYTQVPDWAVEPFIFSGYRPIIPSYKSCLNSIFKIHNETGNIWSHLLGALFIVSMFFVTSFYTIPRLEKFGNVDFGSRIFIYVYLTSALFCLLASSLFHTFICHSDQYHVANLVFSLNYYYGMAFMYLSGTAIYALRVPERWCAGKLDLLGHSHQIFHVFVVIAIIFHYIGIVNALKYLLITSDSN